MPVKSRTFTSAPPHDHVHDHNSWNNSKDPHIKRWRRDHRDGSNTDVRATYYHKHSHYAGKQDHHIGNKDWDSERDQPPTGEYVNWGSGGDPYRPGTDDTAGSVNTVTRR